ncbi:MAG: TnpV protein [Firmicutes bacterium]|nr:TnpV protein [Bacillota bacterium]
MSRGSILTGRISATSLTSTPWRLSPCSVPPSAIFLNSHLEEVDRQANEMMERLTRQMAEKQCVTERLKAEDQMKWVQMMNSIRHSAEEVILNDLIYA